MIINKIILALASIMVTILISGCDNTPSCSDGNVKELVIDVANEEIEKEIVLEMIGRKISIEELEVEMEGLYKKLSSVNIKVSKMKSSFEIESYFDPYPALYVQCVLQDAIDYKNLPKTARKNMTRAKMLNEFTEIVRNVVEKIIESTKNSISDTSLQAIRLDNKDDELEKVQCKGQLKFANGNTHDIEYTAQNTEDGQLYVEVMGL